MPVLPGMPRKRSSEIRRARQAAVYEQNKTLRKTLRREANAQVRAAIEPQVAEPQVAEPRVSEPQVAEPQVAEPQVSEPQIAEPQVAEPPVAEPQVAEPQVAEPQVAEPQAAQPQAIKQKSLEQRIRQAVEIFNTIHDHRRRIPPQLLPPPVPPREVEDVLQLAHEDVLQLAYEDEA
ncbi:hypothetical protein DAPPUDRAFT_252533 [Daphnia pulex]|uniref:Uncharacterized protein n=1 Tax=Daphnia pulex TaxID=6669 RepID=E9H2X1_DAPPU|nr:hypothetical protein DAPPUDRAFT_252533 [Daphnia pulex]|eukprot:EFX73939.1 hypothetical protein DAPPUDRAFT_252533 [Daphnia pulex]